MTPPRFLMSSLERVKRSRIALTTGVVLLTGLAGAQGQERDRWMAPSEARLLTTDRPLRDASSARYLRAEGDFDGDGIQDRAALMVQQRVGLAGVLLYRDGQEPLVVRTFPIARLGSLGISAVRPGSYQPACARGIGVDCAADTRVRVPHDAIVISTFESHAAYVWIENGIVRSMDA